jgi:hypothetical protein
VEDPELLGTVIRVTHLWWTERPTLDRPVLVAAFEGWNDAGDAATSAVRAVIARYALDSTFSVDTEVYYDYQQVRPTIEFTPDEGRRINWPTATLFSPTDISTKVHVLLGTEPSRSWPTFAASFLDEALAADITGGPAPGYSSGQAQAAIERVLAESRVPVLAHLEGNCHTYLHESADPAMAMAIVLNAKLRQRKPLPAPPKSAPHLPRAPRAWSRAPRAHPARSRL